MTKTFDRLATAISNSAGHPLAFLAAIVIIVVWALLGPVFGFSDTWQLIVNTLTTIVTFLMVFLIQNAQMRDTCALQIKLDELIRAIDQADNATLDLEDLDAQTLARIRARYSRLAARARDRGDGQTSSPAH